MSDYDDKIKKLLAEGEQVILSDSAGIDLSLRGKLVLTSKRLLLCGAKGTFNRDYVIKKESELKDTANVVGELGKTSILGVTDNSWLVIKPKIGETLKVGFDVGSMMLWDYNNAQTMQMTKVNNWVNSIKLELLKLERDFGFCDQCGKKLPQGNFEFYPHCGEPLKS